MSVILREGNPADADAIARILSDWIDNTSWMPRVHSRDEDRGFGHFLLANTKVSVADEGGIAIGFLARRDAEIDALYVDAPARGQGIGSRLLSAQKSACEFLALWTFQANQPARTFYAKHGFREIHETDGQTNDEKLPDVRLEWRAQASEDAG